MFRRLKNIPTSAFALKRNSSAQAEISFDAKTVKDFEEMPSLSRFEVIKRFLPGGKFHQKNTLEIQKLLRDELGTIFRMPGMFGQSTNVTTFDAGDIEYVHRNEGVYPYRRGLETMKYFRDEIRSDIFDVGGLIVEQGHEWQKMRSAINPILMKPRTVKSYIPIIDEIANEFIENIPKIQDANGEMPGNFHQLLNRWSLESITAITLEERLGLMNLELLNTHGLKIQETIRKIITLAAEFEMKPSLWKIYETKKFKELLQAYDDLTNLSADIIDKAMAKYEKTDSLLPEDQQGILFKLLQKDKKYAIVMALDMIFGGVDTTSSALAFIMYCLAKNPQKQEKLRSELIKIMPNENTPLNEENMKNLPYLRAVIKETLRLYPPATVNMRRTTTDDLVLRGYQIPKGIDIILGMVGLYKDPNYFESPNEFIPERFLRPESNVETCPMSLKQKHSFAFLPFGFGPRFCVGKRIAEMELETFTCRLFRKYQVDWNHPDMKLEPTIFFLLPKSELRFKLKKL